MGATHEHARLLSRLERLDRRIADQIARLEEARVSKLPSGELEDLVASSLATRDIYLSMLSHGDAPSSFSVRDTAVKGLAAA